MKAFFLEDMLRSHGKKKPLWKTIKHSYSRYQIPTPFHQPNFLSGHQRQPFMQTAEKIGALYLEHYLAIYTFTAIPIPIAIRPSAFLIASRTPPTKGNWSSQTHSISKQEKLKCILRSKCYHLILFVAFCPLWAHNTCDRWWKIIKGLVGLCSQIDKL